MVTGQDGPRRAERSEASGEEQRPAPAPGARGDVGDVGGIMGQIARSLQQAHGDVERTLQAITTAAVATIPGAEECTITYVIGRRRVEPRASTSDMPRLIDEAQDREQEGPCLDATREQRTVRIDDMAAETRWPRFAAAATELGARSSLSLHLFVEGDDMGALNVYARAPHAFGDESEDVGLVFAAHAAVALTGARKEAHLREAVDHRDLIGQAKGILMERHKLTADQAFDVLARSSQRTNRKLLDIAGELTETGALPDR